MTDISYVVGDGVQACRFIVGFNMRIGLQHPNPVPDAFQPQACLA